MKRLQPGPMAGLPWGLGCESGMELFPWLLTSPVRWGSSGSVYVLCGCGDHQAA